MGERAAPVKRPRAHADAGFARKTNVVNPFFTPDRQKSSLRFQPDILMASLLSTHKLRAPFLLPLGAAVAMTLAQFLGAVAPAQAQSRENARKVASGDYVIPADGAYGVEECISRSSECGKVVASAWCEAHGHSGVRGFGPASDVTFSTGAAPAKPLPRNAIVISCQD